MKIFLINNKGEIEEKNYDRKKFALKLELNIRDLRPVFLAMQVSTILPRKNSLIINLGFIKAILTKNNVYFLRHNKSQTFDGFLNDLIKKIKLNQHSTFYLFIFEKILAAKSQQIKGKILNIETISKDVLKEIKGGFSEKSLEKILVLKKRVSRMEFRLQELVSAVREVLDIDTNFSELVSLGNNFAVDKIEVESILENFLEQTEDEVGHLFRVKEEIDDTQEFLDLKLSNKRTAIVRFDLIATLLTLILSILALITGLFGVNLKNG